MLMRLLRGLLRHRYTEVLGAIRTSKWREGTSTGVACMVVMQRQRLVVVAASSGFDGSAEDVGESGTLALEILSMASGEESD
jgi:RNA 3'-terminal phosphate cyclase